MVARRVVCRLPWWDGKWFSSCRGCRLGVTSPISIWGQDIGRQLSYKEVCRRASQSFALRTCVMCINHVKIFLSGLTDYKFWFNHVGQMASRQMKYADRTVFHVPDISTGYPSICRHKEKGFMTPKTRSVIRRASCVTLPISLFDLQGHASANVAALWGSPKGSRGSTCMREKFVNKMR